jgi:hypothetical protein
VTDMKPHDRPDERHAWMIRSWHLAILRFAVTLDNADRLGVFAVAAEVDRLGEQKLGEQRFGEQGYENGGDERRFGFFRKTSADLCAALLRHDPTADAVLRQYLARIDDPRLRHAFAAVTGIEPRGTMSAKRTPKEGNSLWRGLATRGNVHP